eukprot:TRINITY_DN4625_c0_g4_i1.p2 TRINITY_DN4625_c0_g4~~TRINITY_DN4625_c0_g4_i1.p2  ORF type:complete len:101 (-),score=4.66 TRINITY_DN4625_c0_g4_i1:82-384(-)
MKLSLLPAFTSCTPRSMLYSKANPQPGIAACHLTPYQNAALVFHPRDAHSFHAAPVDGLMHPKCVSTGQTRIGKTTAPIPQKMKMGIQLRPPECFSPAGG